MKPIAPTLDQHDPAAATRRDTGLAKSTVTVAHRALLRYVRTPQLIVLSTVQMSVFFLIYRYMLGGAIHIAGMHYVDYLVPGFIATGVPAQGWAVRSRKATPRAARGSAPAPGRSMTILAIWPGFSAWPLAVASAVWPFRVMTSSTLAMP